MKQAMILAAGLGTRLKPLTDFKPKALVEINGQPLLKIVIERLKEAGFKHFTINVCHFADMIVDYLKDNNNFNVEINISDESEMLLETGGAIKKASKFFYEDYPVLIHNTDIISNVNLNNLYEEGMKNDATLLVSKRETSRYLLFKNNDLQGWINTKTQEIKPKDKKINFNELEQFAFSGIHTIKPNFIKEMNVWEDKFSIIDFYLQNSKKYNIKSYQQDDFVMIDAGKPNALIEAEKLLTK